MAKLRSVFRSEAATASHLDGNKLMRSLGNTPSALNEKQKKTCFLIFLLSSLFSLPSSLCPRSRQRSHQGAGWWRKGSAPKREDGREQRKERREKRENGRKLDSLHFTRSRGHLEKVLKIRGCYEEGRQLESLHFYRVPWPPRWRAKRVEKKASKLRSFFEKAVFRFEVVRGCPVDGRQPD